MFLRYVYYISKAYGLTPFAYDATSKRVKKSLTATASGLLICVLFNTAQLSVILYIIVTDWNSEHSKFIDTLVKLMGFLALTFRNLSMQLIFLHRRNDLIKMLNQVYDFLCTLNDVCPDMKLLPKGYLKTKQTIIVFKVIQTLAIVLMSFFHIINRQAFVTILYLQMLTCPMIITSFYFCGTILASARFFDSLNWKLKHLSANVLGINSKSNVGQEIECATVLYDRFTNLVRKINKILGLPIGIFMIATFFFCLYIVSGLPYAKKLKNSLMFFYSFSKLIRLWLGI